jgi:DNA-binding GntR family transcriptional regulator
MREKLDRTSTSSRVAEWLRDRISSGEVDPGGRIVELEVSRELGVSRSPVREALLKLAEEGLVTIVPYRGAIVAPLDRERFRELIEVRLALEHFALEALIASKDKGAYSRLHRDVDAIAQAIASGNSRRAFSADLDMHRNMIALTRNSLLVRTYDGLLNQIRLYIRVTSERYERIEDLADEHVAMLDAIERGDRTMARSILDAHVMHGFDEAMKAP